jgi:hypothetical protein
MDETYGSGYGDAWCWVGLYAFSWAKQAIRYSAGAMTFGSFRHFLGRLNQYVSGYTEFVVQIAIPFQR